MNYSGHRREKNIARCWWPIFFFLALLLPSGARATDCDTNCEDACPTWSWRLPCGIGCWRDVEVIDEACKVRCDAEKATACETGLNFCDLEKITKPNEWWQAKTVMQRAADAQVIHDYKHCEDIVNDTGGVASAADFLLDLGLPPGVVSLAQHFFGCICNELAYGNSPNDDDPTVPDSPEGGIAAGVLKDGKKEAVSLLFNQYMMTGF